MHPRNFGSVRIVRTYHDVQKSVLHVQIRPIDLSITYKENGNAWGGWPRLELTKPLATIGRQTFFANSFSSGTPSLQKPLQSGGQILDTLIKTNKQTNK